MASLGTLVPSAYKEPTLVVRFDGNRTKDVLSIEMNHSLEGEISSATVTTLSRPPASPESKVTIQQGYNGAHALTFTGYVDTIEYNEFEERYVIQCRDVLKKALDTFLVQEVAFGLDIDTGEYSYSTYSSNDGGTFTIHKYASLSALNTAHPETTGNYTGEGVKAEAVVQWMLVMCGFAEGSEIQVDPTDFFIGDLKPANFHLTTVYDAIGQIADLIGWRVYADTGGVVRFRRIPRNSSGYATWTYSSLSSPFNIDKVSKSETNTDLRNYVEVRGASGITVIKRASSPYIGNTPYRGVLISDELIDTPGMANYVANRVLADLNRLKVTVSLAADCDPRIKPGDTLKLNTNRVRGNYLVDKVSSNVSADGGYKMQIEAKQYVGAFDDDYTEPDQQVVAQFTAIQVVRIGDPRYIVEFDASSSYSSRGAITQYTWTWPDSTTTTSASPVAYFAFQDTAISNGNSQNVTLVATDELGFTGTTTSGITYESITSEIGEQYRHLYGALNTVAVGSLDGGLIWNSSSIPAISCAASNFEDGGVYTTSGYALFGTSDAKIYRTTDGCQTVTLVYTTTDDVTAMNIDEMNSSYALAGTADGKIIRSTNGGLTWAVIKDFAFPINEVRYGYNNPKYMLVIGDGAGNTYESFDSGVTFNRIGGALLPLDVNRESSGSQTNYYAHTTGIMSSLAGTPTAATFPGSGSYNIVAMTIAVDDDNGIQAVDSAGLHWVTSGELLMVSTQDNAANLTRHMLRDGEIPIITYYATQSGISKSLDRNYTIQELHYPGGGVDGKMVAYGPMIQPIIPPGILVLAATSDVTNSYTYSGGPTAGGNGIYVNTANGWTMAMPYSVQTPQNIATTPGYVIAYDSTSSALGLMKLVPSGYPTYNTNWYNNSPDTVGWVGISRKQGDKRVFLADQGTLVVEMYRLRTFEDFFDAPNPTDIGVYVDVNGRQSTFNRHLRHSSDTFTWRYWASLFADTELRELTIAADGTSSYSLIDTGTLDYADVSPTMLQASGMSIHYNNLGVAPLGWLRAESGSLGSMSFDSGAPVNHYAIRDSVTPGDIIYATSTAVKRVSGYGDGSTTTMYSVPSGYTVAWMTVTNDSALTKDYITIVCNPSAGYVDKVFYSNDSGATWVAGPDINRGAADYTAGVWYVDYL